MQPGIVAHELGHSLGFWHEQSRPDRDQFIVVKSNNAIGASTGQFERRPWSEIDDYGGKYDLGSVTFVCNCKYTASVARR